MSSPRSRSASIKLIRLAHDNLPATEVSPNGAIISAKLRLAGRWVTVTSRGQVSRFGSWDQLGHDQVTQRALHVCMSDLLVTLETGHQDTTAKETSLWQRQYQGSF